MSDRPTVESVLILDDDWTIIPDGFSTRRRAPAQIEHFRDLFTRTVVPDLRRRGIALNVRGHLHRSYEGRPYLFSYTRRASGARTLYIVVEADLTYLVGTVFPQYFAVTSSRVYQVVDEVGDLVYGYAFSGVPDSRVVELGFPDTLSQWRLRVAQREEGLVAARGTRRVLDLVLIAIAAAVIVAGLAVLLVAARRERRANELKSEFISNVSHELKTPLSIISMFAEMLHTGRTTSPEQAHDYAGVIARESTRLDRLIDNVLDFSRIERGAVVYELQDADFAEVVERSLDVCKHRLERAGLSLHVDIEPELPHPRMDDNAMTLVVLNLVDNAIKYAASGERLVVSLARDGDGIALRVRDFGPGIEPDEQQRVFERFYRARSVRLKPARGAGIGLALVEHITRAHGGTVAVESSPGEGATFTIWIPTGQG